MVFFCLETVLRDKVAYHPPTTLGYNITCRPGYIFKFAFRHNRWRGVACSGTEWCGMARTGVEAWSGMEWRGAAWTGMEWRGIGSVSVDVK